MHYKILARHNHWVDGATVTELQSENGQYRRYVATVNGWRNFVILSGIPTAQAQSYVPLVQSEVRRIHAAIIAGDDNVFVNHRPLEPESATGD